MIGATVFRTGRLGLMSKMRLEGQNAGRWRNKSVSLIMADFRAGKGTVPGAYPEDGQTTPRAPS